VAEKKAKFDAFFGTHYPLKSSQDVEKEVLDHWVYRLHLVQNAQTQHASRLALLDSFIVQYRLTTLYDERDSLEKIMETDGIRFKPVFMEDDYEDDEHHSKRRKHSHSSEEGFIGWKFKENGAVEEQRNSNKKRSSSQSKSTYTQTFSIPDAIVYLY
jgi:hypothetical protein